MFKFNVILDNPPTIQWGSIIDKTDFKQVLKYFRLLEDDRFNEEEKIKVIIHLFFNEMPTDENTWDEIQKFISCNEEKEGSSGKRVFDYNVDHGRLFAAFLQTYGIDLRTAEFHWWTFCELFQALPDDTKLMQIIDLRSKKPSKHDSEEYKRQLRKMQQAYRLNDSSRALEDALDRW